MNEIREKNNTKNQSSIIDRQSLNVPSKLDSVLDDACIKNQEKYLIETYDLDAATLRSFVRKLCLVSVGDKRINFYNNLLELAEEKGLCIEEETKERKLMKLFTSRQDNAKSSKDFITKIYDESGENPTFRYRTFANRVNIFSEILGVKFFDKKKYSLPKSNGKNIPVVSDGLDSISISFFKRREIDCTSGNTFIESFLKADIEIQQQVFTLLSEIITRNNLGKQKKGISNISHLAYYFQSLNRSFVGYRNQFNALYGVPQKSISKIMFIKAPEMIRKIWLLLEDEAEITDPQDLINEISDGIDELIEAGEFQNLRGEKNKA